MRILICSDAHGDEAILLDKLNKYPDFDHYFYLGDSELMENNLIFDKFVAVLGNMDYGDFPETVDLKDRGINFFLTHGHLFEVNRNLENLRAEAKKVGADVICFGHTHLLTVQEIDQQLIINPGSISQPRNFIQEKGTYVILEITDTTYQVFCYNRADQLLELPQNPLIFERTK
ncbi:metallophosphoesterase family protein [Xylocopilactobacillus apicola]|uniref:Phosphoesterase n=1 Tax=Xylocopilactobacillus apicola TaxID=2932184 RepID=A0AAU9DS22_9LACO|nr:metallophosphoesterase [Xylocopilactobacillus apicola]BDR58789.1 phosphoesterase [Xylocopilactobacillus apicola]